MTQTQEYVPVSKDWLDELFILRKGVYMPHNILSFTVKDYIDIERLIQHCHDITTLNKENESKI